MPASEADLSALCLACGLCCDGSLFGRVDLRPEEADAARRHGLRVVAGGRSFEQPCGAYAADDERGPRSCRMYDERPRACRRFVCRLYDGYRRDGGALEGPLARVRRARQLLALVDVSLPEGPLLDELRELLDESFGRA